MLMRTDPFRELDRLTQSVWGPQGRPAMPMTAYRQDGTTLTMPIAEQAKPRKVEIKGGEVKELTT